MDYSKLTLESHSCNSSAEFNLYCFLITKILLFLHYRTISIKEDSSIEDLCEEEFEELLFNDVDEELLNIQIEIERMCNTYFGITRDEYMALEEEV